MLHSKVEIPRMKVKISVKMNYGFTLLLLGILASNIITFVRPYEVTMSGFSSGGAMTMQFHLSHSKLVNGVGIFGALPFACGYFSNSTLCHNVPDEIYFNEIKRQAEIGKIDPLSYVQNSKVFIFHGALDIGIKPELGLKIQTIYQWLGASVTAEFGVQAQDGFPTMNQGTQCELDSTSTHYISNCSYNGAYSVLNNLFGSENHDLVYPTSRNLTGNFYTFNQSAYIPAEIPSAASISMDSIAYVFIPEQCINRTGTLNCTRLHVALHGCKQSRAIIGEIFIRQTGYAEVSDINDIVVIFPQALPTIDTANGCWNWWGYLDGVEYLNKNSPQIQTIYNIIESFSSSIDVTNLKVI